MNNQDAPQAGDMAVPEIRRVRHEPRRRTLRVLRSERLTPNMQRLTLGGPELRDFASESPDDHIKLFFPQPGGGEEMRDYTPRRFDRDKGELVVDFVVHEGGPATAWAKRAKPGDALAVGGPRGSRVIAGPIRRWLFVGDESALPAIGRFVEELPAGDRATLAVSVPGADDAQVLASRAEVSAHWIARDGGDAGDPAPLLRALAALEIPGDCFVWAAAEAGVARAIRRHLIDERGHPPKWMKIAGYWVRGEANASIKDLDESPG
ncbi:MAG: siderophore-interacting protein [Pseudoxanthomonas sp.]